MSDELSDNISVNEKKYLKKDIAVNKGNFGTIYKVNNIIIKSIKYDKIINNPHINIMQNISSIREIAFLQYLNSPLIVSYIKHTPKYLFMKYAGITLNELYKTEIINLTLLKSIIKQSITALSYLQLKHVIHCDIKPENITISEPISNDLTHRNIKLIDFNISTITGPNQIEKVYTPLYRSLETIYYGISHKSDIWALGCTIAELVNKIPLFANTNNINDTESDNINRIINRLGMPSIDCINKYKLNKLINLCEHSNNNRKIEPIVYDKELNSFLQLMLEYDIDKRWSATELLNHPYMLNINKIDDNDEVNKIDDNNEVNKIDDLNGINSTITLFANRLYNYLKNNCIMEFNKFIDCIINKSDYNNLEYNIIADELLKWIANCSIKLLKHKKFNIYDCSKNINHIVQKIDFKYVVLWVLNTTNGKLLHDE
jgi:serine/threonine protein kinase